MTITDFLRKKKRGEQIRMLTAYDYTTAGILAETDIDGILVGDSLGNVFQGNATTIPVNIDEMCYHTRVVARGAPEKLIVADLPFLSYQTSVSDAVKNAGQLLKEGAHAVKLEGGTFFKDTVYALVQCGIPVMGHLGLCPQYVHSLGGYKKQGKTEEQKNIILNDAKILEESGIFSLVLECVPENLAEKISGNLSVPTIGIGAGEKCDGQILVINDLIGLTRNPPKFARRYADMRGIIKDSVQKFIDNADVKSDFEEEKQVY